MRSLRSRLMLYLLIGSGAILAVGGAILYRVIAGRLERGFDDAMISKARSIALLAEQDGPWIWLEFADEAMPEFERLIRPEFFQIWRADGRLLERSRSLKGQDLKRLALPGTAPQLWAAELPDGRPGRYSQVTFQPRREADEAGEHLATEPRTPHALEPPCTIVYARGREELDNFIDNFRVSLALAGFGLLVGLALLTRLSLGLGLAPLSRLIDRIERLDAASLAERIDPTDVPVEISAVVQRINDLLGRLETSFVREKAFSSHLAHELRTPLAELRAATEVGLRWPDDPASVAASLEDARAIGLHMERIAENLLALARSESAQEMPVEEPVLLRSAIEEAWRPLARAAAERKVELRNEIPEGVILPTDRAKLGLILSNLLDNAVAHSTPGGWVACRALPSNRSGAVSGAATSAGGVLVINPAADLLPADLPHLFDRFWRKDGARSGPHAGLGLPLVASLARSLGLFVTADLSAGNLEIRLGRA